MQIQLDEQMLKGVVSEAILKAIDENQRNALVQGAITHLLTPQGGSGFYGKHISPIQEAFNSAVRDVAMKIAGEMLVNDEVVTEKIRTLLNEAMTLVMETNREATVRNLADSIAAGMAYRER